MHSEIGRRSDDDFSDLRIEHAIEAANNGDCFTRNIFENVATHIGTKLSDVANLLNPELIILRGPVIDSNRFLFDNIRRIVDNLSLRPIAQALRIEFAEGKEDVQAKVSAPIFSCGTSPDAPHPACGCLLVPCPVIARSVGLSAESDPRQIDACSTLVGGIIADPQEPAVPDEPGIAAIPGAGKLEEGRVPEKALKLPG